jgi:hypothetical protein
MANETVRIGLVLNYGVNYKTDGGIIGDVGDALNQLNFSVHTASRQEYKDGVATVVANLYVPAGFPLDEVEEAAQAAVNKHLVEKNYPGAPVAEVEEAEEEVTNAIISSLSSEKPAGEAPEEDLTEEEGISEAKEAEEAKEETTEE